MSTFNIYQKLEYAVILADSLGQRNAEGGNIVPLLAPKLVHVAPCIYAAHAGMWQPALKMLDKVNHFVTSEGKNITHKQFCDKLTHIGQETLTEYKALFKQDVLDVKVPIVVTGKYRHPQDVSTGCATSILIWETANNFVPTRTAVQASWAVEAKITSVMVSIMGLPTIEYLLNSGPLAVAQTLDAVHAFISRVTTFVSQDANILLVGKDEEFSLLKGQLIRLPNEALIWG